MEDLAIYQVMPEMLIDFAKRSQVDSGYRLYCRAIRHASDSRTPSIEEGSAQLVMDSNGDVGICLHSKIPASMKKDIYNPGAVVTLKKLLCAMCN